MSARAHLASKQCAGGEHDDCRNLRCECSCHALDPLADGGEALALPQPAADGAAGAEPPPAAKERRASSGVTALLVEASGATVPLLPNVTAAPAPPAPESAELDGMVFEPIPRRKGAAKPLLTDEQARALRARPGEWARLVEYPGISSAHQRRKRWADNPGEHGPDEWEVRARRMAGGSRLYVRYHPRSARP